MILYTKSFCPWCISARRWLKKHGYSFQEIEVRRNPEAFAEMRQLSGQTLAPTLVTKEGKVLADFGIPELRAFIDQHQLRP